MGRPITEEWNRGHISLRHLKTEFYKNYTLLELTLPFPCIKIVLGHLN
jgi:hypothetical protein